MFVKEITSKETHPLRIKILRKGISKNYQFNEDNFKSTIHLGAFTENNCVGILSLIKKGQPDFTDIYTYQLRGMAIDFPYQQRGIGSKLVLESFKILRAKKVVILWCNAREVAKKFYLKKGFQIRGTSFEIAGIGTHYLMIINLDKACQNSSK